MSDVHSFHIQCHQDIWRSKALTYVSLEIEEGKIHAIIGPNGAGKSTLLNCFVGRLTPDSGTVTLNGHSLIGRTPHHINQLGVSRVFQTPEIYSGQTVLENVLIPAFSHSDMRSGSTFLPL